MQPEKDDDHAGHLRQQRLVTRHQLADFGRNRTQCNEHDTETQDKHNGVQHYLAQELALRLQLLNPNPGDQRNVSRNQWQNARRKEGNQPCQESRNGKRETGHYAYSSFPVSEAKRKSGGSEPPLRNRITPWVQAAKMPFQP